MWRNREIYRAAALAGFLVFSLSACSTSQGDGADQVTTDDEVAAETEQAEVVQLSFSPPADCTTLLPESAIAGLAAEGIELVKGPGSSSTEPIFVEGNTPEELVGGISCLYSVPGEEEAAVSILLSVAPVTEAARPGVINDLLAQNLNVGQSRDGALTYWIWGDDFNVPALHNNLYPDSWYSALLQPGGRAAYDKGVGLLEGMRQQTTR
ncbi:MAG: hypothetical protein K9G08_02215 [Pontimonas sp.]|nr:MAG: hypothetical protein GM43_0165 [actinobacterium acMicro-4]MCF8522561.1 hypothetical protein [Pontimonas sp.]MCF8547273.1 hypothetical protein [Pontimonas sp.]